MKVIDNGFDHFCDECQGWKRPLIQLGEEPTHYESNTAFVCRECLAEALEFMGNKADTVSR